MAHDVFISYSSKDKASANATCAVLESRNIRCWIAPRDVQPGQPYGEAIIDAIHGCRIMVLVLSSNANASGHIPKEVERAVSNGVTIIPLRIEDVTPGKSLDYFIGSVHWLDAMTPPLEKHLAELGNTISKILQETRTGPGPAVVVGAPAERARVTAAAPAAQKRSLPTTWIYAGAGLAALVILGVFAVIFWPKGQTTPSPIVQPSPQQSVVRPVPAADTTQVSPPQPINPEPVPTPAPSPVVPPQQPATARTSPITQPAGSNRPSPAGSASPLLPQGDASSLRQQGLYYRDKEQNLSLAIQYFDQAVRLQPNFPEALANRGDAYLFQGDLNRAAADYDEAIRLDPNLPDSYHRRGIIRMLAGQYGTAAQDLRMAIESNQPNPDKPYDPIWLYLAETKGGQNGRADLMRYASRMGFTGWPEPAVGLFLGTSNPNSILAGARSSDQETNARQLCQAYYFLGEYMLFSGQRGNAAQLFQQSLAMRQTRQFAYFGAESELRNLR